MRYRKLTATGDMTFGNGVSNFWVNQPEGVAQAVKTRLRLVLGEWFYDTTDGTAWFTKILGNNTRATRDPVVRNRTLQTTGMQKILAFSSGFDPQTRTYTVNMTFETVYGNSDVTDLGVPVL